MSKEAIKNEINEVLDHLSDNSLEELLFFLKQLEQKQSFLKTDFSNLEKILLEDKELLNKLAQ